MLHQHLSDLVAHRPHIILDLAQVEFVDSSGLGLLVRFLSRTHQARGGLKLCAVPPRVAEVLRVTRLSTSFDVHASADEAVVAFCQGSTSEGASDQWRTDVLCVEQSADVLAFVREVLKQADRGRHHEQLARRTDASERDAAESNRDGRRSARGRITGRPRASTTAPTRARWWSCRQTSRVVMQEKPASM